MRRPGWGLFIGMGSSLLMGAAPCISRVNDGRGWAIVFGEHFTPDTQLVSWRPVGEEKEFPASEATVGQPVALPAEPPPEARPVPGTVFRSAQVLMAPLDGAPAVVWARNPAGTSAPFVVNRPEIWSLADPVVTPGQRVRLFGVKFRPNPWHSHVYCLMKSVKTGQSVRPVPGAIAGQAWINVMDYEFAFLCPEVEPGDYEVYVHGGWGGPLGWSEPARVTVIPRRDLIGALRRPEDACPIDGPVRVVKAEGLRADGASDDTGAIQKALDATAGQGGGLVLLPPGLLAITRTLHVPAGVCLRGAGMEATTITVAPGAALAGGFPPVETMPSLPYERGFAGDWFPFMKTNTPMVWIETQAGLMDLGLVAGPGADAAVTVATRDWRTVSRDVFLVRVKILNTQRLGAFPPRFHPKHFGVDVWSATVGFTLFHCTIKAGDPLVMLPTRPPHRYTAVVGNTLTVYPRQSTNNVFTDSIQHGRFEDNRLEDGGRAFTSQQGCAYNWFFNNLVEGVGRQGNSDEMFMSEHAGTVAFGTVEKAEGVQLRLSDRRGWKDGQVVEPGMLVLAVVARGRGFGQVRVVVDNQGDTVVLDRPWTVGPDPGSQVLLTRASFRNLYINNTTRHCDGRCDFTYGSSVECVVAGHHSRASEGFCFWSLDPDLARKEYYVCAHHRIVGNQVWYDGRISLRDGTAGARAQKRIPADFPRTVGVMGCRLIENHLYAFRQFDMNQYWPIWDRPGFPSADAALTVAGDYNVIAGNFAEAGPIGVYVEDGRANLVSDNRLVRVAVPVVDRGEDTLVRAHREQKYEAVKVYPASP